MKPWLLLMFLLAGSVGRPVPGCAQVEAVTNPSPQSIFFGDGRVISVSFHNETDDSFSAGVHARLWQTSSATAIYLGDTPWKTLQVLPGQTILESAALDFPPVKAKTKFHVQWLANANHLLGTTEVLAYPTNLLQELKPLLGNRAENLGLLDPHQQLLPALKNAAIKYVDLDESDLTNFSGWLVLVGPCLPADPEWNGLTRRIEHLAMTGIPVVWIQSSPPQPDKLWPSFYAVPKKQAVVVVVQPELVADLPDNPQSQLNLIYFCKLALRPQPLTLPDLTIQP